MLAPLADGTNLDYKRNRVTMTARRRLVHLALLITSALGTVGADVAVAQTTAQFPIQFDFLNPGARSLAMGSAFSGLADDASAAFTNPAGLLQLTRPEVSAEGRRRQLDTRFLAAGRINGNVLNIGEDRTAGPVYDESSDSSFGPSFLSFTYPMGRIVVAGYRHELTRVSNEFLYRGVFERVTFAGITDDRARDLPLTGTRRISIDTYGGAIGFRINDRLNVGAGVNIVTFDLEASFRRLGFTGDLFGPPDLSQTGSTATQQGEDTAAGYTVGFQAQVTPQVKVGGVFRKAPDFGFTQVDAIPSRPVLVRAGKFQVPDTLAVGVAYRPDDNFVIVADYVRVGHAALKEDFIDIQAISSGREDQLAIDDANEFHVGAEWVLAQVRFTPALRGGLWFDPDHSVRYVPSGSGDQLDTRFRFILPGDEDSWHYTFGGGLSLSRALEVNAGADLSRRGSQVSASLILRFF
jgi:long-chain fatty acid transport protein